MKLATISVGILILVLSSVICPSAPVEESSVVPYPTAYRTWVMVKSYVITPESKLFADRGGIHHYFANDKAIEGYQTGKFPEGAIIVDEGMNIENAQGVTTESGLRSVDVMHKDAAFKASGGWGYGRFEGDSTIGIASPAIRSACTACHAKAKGGDHVYSTSRLIVPVQPKQ